MRRRFSAVFPQPDTARDGPGCAEIQKLKTAAMLNFNPELKKNPALNHRLDYQPAFGKVP